MAESCKDATIVAKQTANFNRAEGLNVFGNILQSQPEIAGVFAHNDEMILGAIEAAKAANRTGITFVGFDAVDDAVNAVKGGTLTGTIAQQPALIGDLGVRAAVDHLNGVKVEANVPVPISVVQKLTLGLSLSTLNNPFFVTLRDGAQKAADAAGTVALVVVDSQDDSAKEAANIEDLISQKVDAILINPTNSDAIVASVEAANKAGIPVFTVDRGANGGEIVSHIASDNVAGGVMAAEYLCAQLGGKGKVVELQGIAGTSAATDRGAGFNKYMSENCKDVQIVAAQTANFNRAEGLNVFGNILQAQPEINGVFAHNDEMILGAIEAAKAATRTGIVFVGFDAVDDAVKAVEAGDLAATVAQQPALIGELGVVAAIEALGGKDVAKNTPVALSLVAK
jgi:ribose transport system substrate-binding protein